jgi:hypothetical protein
MIIEEYIKILKLKHGFLDVISIKIVGGGSISINFMESEQLASVNLLFMFFHKKNLIILSIFPCDSLLGTTKFILKILFPKGILYLFGRPAKSKGSGSSSFPRKFYQGRNEDIFGE